MPRKKSPAKRGDEPGFEESIDQLESIVAAMEEESLPLEELVSKYEQGTQLLTRCEKVLQSAKTRLKTIAARSESGSDNPPEDSGNPLTDDKSTDTDLPDDDDDDIRLF